MKLWQWFCFFNHANVSVCCQTSAVWTTISMRSSGFQVAVCYGVCRNPEIVALEKSDALMMCLLAAEPYNTSHPSHSPLSPLLQAVRPAIWRDAYVSVVVLTVLCCSPLRIALMTFLALVSLRMPQTDYYYMGYLRR